MTQISEAATALAEHGYVVFPVSASKRPMVRFGALRRGAHLAAGAERWPALGLRTGDGLAVIDVDPKNGGQADPSWPLTYIETTPSGGVHFFYRTDRDVRNSAGKLAKGVDVRGYHGFVVIAPSPGYGVAVDRPMAWLPDLPAAVISNDRDSGLPPGWRPFQPRDRVGRGEQHAYMLSFGAWVWRQANGSMSMDELELLMWSHAEQVLDDWAGPSDQHEQRLMLGRVAWIVGHEC